MNNIFNVCLLDSNGNPNKVFIFSGNDKINTNELFSEFDNINFKKHNTQFIYCNQFIYKDDNIKNIKRKILIELNHEISYQELYLFGKTVSNYSIESIYENISKNNNNSQVSFSQYNQFNNNLLNFNYNITQKDFYDITDFYDLLLPKKLEHFTPVGKSFTNYFDYVFSSNPFLLEKNPVTPNNRNTLITFDNSLLLDYNISSNIIYLCSAPDLLVFANENSINHDFIINNYFPLLTNDNIYNLDQLNAKKDELISREKNKVKTNSQKYFEQIDLFYKIFENNTKPIQYLSNGINNTSISLISNKKTLLPLDDIFKIIHSSKEIPFIKFNPGKKKENIFRIFSEFTSKNGKKIPYLNRVTILNLSKNIGKGNKQISFYLEKNINGVKFEIIIDLLLDSNINIHIKSEQFFDLLEIDKIISESVNPIIKKINIFLEQFGYSIHYFESIYTNNIAVMNIDYFKSISLIKKFNYKKYKNFFSSIFDVIDNSKTNVIDLNFKRVSNFKKMDGINKTIYTLFNKENNQDNIISILQDNYNISEEEALNHVNDFLNNFNRINGSLVNKVDTVLENPGFTTTINIIPFDDIVSIKVSEINSFQYIPILNIYIDSVFRLLQYYDSINISNDIITKITSKNIDNNVIENKPIFDVANDSSAKPIEFKKMNLSLDDDPIVKNHYIKNIDDANDDDDGDGIFFEDDELDQQDDIGKKQENDDDDSDDDGFFFEDDDDDIDKDQILGGDKVEDITGMPLTKPNLFFKRLTDREPNLFLTKSDGKYEAYSRMCQHNSGKQPVILTQEEKDKIDTENPGSYTHSIEYGSDPNKKYHYICPRYWCLLTDSSITEEDVKSGKCGKIIPKNATSVPKGHYVMEMHGKITETDSNGNEVEISRVPGFLKSDKHPDGLCTPCCFQDWNSKMQVNRRKECLEGDKKATLQYKKKEYDINYIISFDTSPIPENRFGFLPPSIELFFNEDYTNKINPENNHKIKFNKRMLLRYGVEHNYNQSFIGCIAEVYKDYYKKNNLLSIKEMKKHIIDLLDIDKFVRLQNASLIGSFKNKKRKEIDINPYVNSNLYKKLDASKDIQIDFFKDTISSFKNFINFLKDDNVVIDHTYLWDLICSREISLIGEGMNLIIINVLNNDITDNIEILCPTNSYSSILFESSKPAIILIKNNNYYELVSSVEIIQEGTKSKLDYYSYFSKDQNKHSHYNDLIFNTISNIINNKCKPIKQVSKTFIYKQNKPAIDVYNTILDIGYLVKHQIINYQGKCIGLTINKESKNDIFIPCYPSTIFKKTDIKFMDDESIWNDYVYTRDNLIYIHNLSKGKIFCKPIQKVIENNLIVGIITETNQFIQINPPSEDIFKNDLQYLDSTNYISIDKTISNSIDGDKERIDVYNKIRLESQFFNAFRNTVKILLNSKLNKDVKHKLIKRINDTNVLYKDKLKDIEILIRYFVSNNISFVDYDEKVLNKISDVSTCLSNQKNKNYCLFEDNNYKLILPKKHLFSGVDNEKIYYFRISDEIIRYKYIQNYLLKPNTILSIKNINYDINDNEFILIQSILTNDYFENLDKFIENKYINNITFDLANPENVSNEDKLMNKSSLTSDTIKEDNKFTTKLISLDCIKNILDIDENETDLWRKNFISSRELFLKPYVACTFSVLRIIIYLNIGIRITVNEIKEHIYSVYNKHFQRQKNKIIHILKTQGKTNIMKLIENKKLTLKDAIFSEDYYLTDLDLFAFVTSYKKLPIIIFSNENFKTMNSNINWLLFSNTYKINDITNQKYYFIRTPINFIENSPPSYSIIEDNFSLEQIKYIDTSKLNDFVGKNIESFNDFIQNYNVK